MKEYYVQLETPDLTFGFEVFTDDFDAVDMARKLLTEFTGELTARDAHLGGYDCVGENFNINTKSAQIDSKTVHRILQWCDDSVLL